MKLLIFILSAAVSLAALSECASAFTGGMMFLPVSTPAPAITPPPTGIACDQGPVYTGTLMSSVLTAQFTKCALNADFTTTTTDANNINYSNIATWIAECGAPSRPYNFHTSYWFGVTTDAQGKAACPTALGGNNDFSITTDPLGGGFNVLHAVYTLNDQNNYIAACGSDQCHSSNYKYDNLNLTWPDLPHGAVGMPYEMYKETVVYMPQSAMNSGVSGHTAGQAPSSSDLSSAGLVGASIASDQFEIINSVGYDSGATSWTWNVGVGAQLSPGGGGTSINSGQKGPFNFASGYVTIGQLITSDEANNISACTYLNGSLQPPCINFNMAATGTATCSGGGYACYFHQNSKILMTFTPIGATCFPYLYQQNPVGACLHNNMDFYYKSIRVFTCVNYKTTQCPGPLVTARNSADGQRYANDNSPEGLIKQAITWLRQAI